MTRILVDEFQVYGHTNIRCFKAGSSHLMAEPDERGQVDLEALHAFAAKIGMRREWFQPGHGPALDPLTAHYDLVKSRRELAIRLGAVFVPAREQAKRRLELRRKLRGEVPAEARIAEVVAENMEVVGE